MKQHEADNLAVNLTSVFGLQLKALTEKENGDDVVDVMPVELHPNHGFKIRIVIGWRSLQFSFQLGKFAADFLNSLEQAVPEKKQLFTFFIQQIIENKGAVIFKINDLVADPLSPGSWPAQWTQLNYSLKVSPLEINTENKSLTQQLMNTWAERFLGSVLALAPLEEIETDNFEETIGLPEGAQIKVTVNRYERNRLNRTLCLRHHGTACKVCGFDFGKVYGKIGEGFIHVHHITPVSQLGPGYIIDPVNELIPVCPNCHNMLHKIYPPLKADDLRVMMKTNAESYNF